MRVLPAIALAIFAAVPDRPDPTPKGESPRPDLIQGEWQVVEALARGVPNGVIKPNQTTFRFEKDKMLLRLTPGAGKDFEYQFSTDFAKSPATFDFLLGNGKAAKATVGIVKIEGDTMTICYSFAGAAGRPAEFGSTAASNTALWKLKRVQK